MFQVKVPTETKGDTKGRKSRVGLHHWLHFIMDKEHRLYIVYSACFIDYVHLLDKEYYNIFHKIHFEVDSLATFFFGFTSQSTFMH